MTEGNVTYPLTKGFKPVTSAHYDSNKNMDGLTYTFTTADECIYNKNETFGFQNTVLCNKNVTGLGAVISVENNRSCTPKVTMEHSSACPEYSLNGIVKFLDENVWLSGTILVVFGVVMALFGRAFFRYIMATLATLSGFMAVMYLCSLFGWLETTWVIVVLCLVGVAAGLGCGYLIYQAIPFAVVFLGFVTGFEMGVLLFSLIVGVSGYDELWLLYALMIVSTLGMGVFSWYHKLGFLSFATAVLGGYMFMRGLTFWFGGYPSEAEMMQLMKNG